MQARAAAEGRLQFTRLRFAVAFQATSHACDADAALKSQDLQNIFYSLGLVRYRAGPVGGRPLSVYSTGWCLGPAEVGGIVCKIQSCSLQNFRKEEQVKASRPSALPAKAFVQSAAGQALPQSEFFRVTRLAGHELGACVGLLCLVRLVLVHLRGCKSLFQWCLASTVALKQDPVQQLQAGAYGHSGDTARHE